MVFYANFSYFRKTCLLRSCIYLIFFLLRFIILFFYPGKSLIFSVLCYFVLKYPGIWWPKVLEKVKICPWKSLKVLEFEKNNCVATMAGANESNVASNYFYTFICISLKKLPSQITSNIFVGWNVGLIAAKLLIQHFYEIINVTLCWFQCWMHYCVIILDENVWRSCANDFL